MNSVHTVLQWFVIASCSQLSVVSCFFLYMGINLVFAKLKSLTQIVIISASVSVRNVPIKSYNLWMIHNGQNVWLADLEMSLLWVSSQVLLPVESSAWGGGSLELIATPIWLHEVMWILPGGWMNQHSHPYTSRQTHMGPFKPYVKQWGGVGGVCQLSRKKALRRCTVQRY